MQRSPGRSDGDNERRHRGLHARTDDLSLAMNWLWWLGLCATGVWVLSGQVLFHLVGWYGLDGLLGVAGYWPPGETEYFITSLVFLGGLVGSSWVAFGTPWRRSPSVPKRGLVRNRFVRGLSLGLMAGLLVVGTASTAAEATGLWKSWLPRDLGGARTGRNAILVWAALVYAISFLGVTYVIGRKRRDPVSVDRAAVNVTALHVASVLVVGVSVAVQCYRSAQEPSHVLYEAYGSYTGIFLGWCVYLWSMRGWAVLRQQRRSLGSRTRMAGRC